MASWLEYGGAHRPIGNEVVGGISKLGFVAPGATGACAADGKEKKHGQAQEGNGDDATGA